MSTLTVPADARTASHPDRVPNPHVVTRAHAPLGSDPAAPRRPRAKRGDGDRLRDEILAATETLLLRSRDIAAVSVRAVAEAVGCTAPAIYLHFDDKADLLMEVCAARFRQLADEIDVAVTGVDDPIESLRQSMHAYVRFGMTHPQHYRILFMDRPVLAPDQWQSLRLRGVTGIDALVARCQRAIDGGQIRTTDAYLVAVGIWAINHGIVSLTIARPDFAWPERETIVAHLIDTHLAGLAA